MKFVVVHHHFRPGGVRRVIECALPPLLLELRPTQAILAGGEAPDPAWLSNVRASVNPVELQIRIEPFLAYWAEQRGSRQLAVRRLDEFFSESLGLLPGDVVWVHNPGLGRNLLVPRAIGRAAERIGFKAIFHHHDWFFDNRWHRWSELSGSGFPNLRSVSRAVFPSTALVRHASINQRDAGLLSQKLGARAAWLPNPVARPVALDRKTIRDASKWLESQIGERGPVWLLPARLLRRKNVAEALLLVRWLRPGGWLVTTGGVSSDDELPYATQLATAAKEHRWPLRLSVLHENENRKPSVSALMASAEALVFTSIQEGFGLPYLEASAAGRPLLARKLPNVAPDLAKFGFRFPQSYSEILISADLFDWEAERARQRALFADWRRRLPQAVRRSLGPHLVFETPPRSVPFSRLTLTAQIEVLRQPVDVSWKASLALNPFLGTWQKRAATGSLETSPWSRQADRWLGGPAYAGRFRRLLQNRAGALPEAKARELSASFVRERLLPDNRYPLLWNTVT